MVLLEAREKLSKLTPLKTDCGRLCGAACCRSAEGETTGMLLFPGEDKLDMPEGSTVIGTDTRKVLVCGGSCHRDERPLSCRMFPLLPDPETGSVEVDARARAVCPMAGESIDSFAPAFVQAVAQVGQLLQSDPCQGAFLKGIFAEHCELKQLQKRFGR